MPVEVAPANNTRVIVSQTEGRNVQDRTGWENWPAATFIGLSGFVLAAELIDLTQAVNGYFLSSLKYLTPLLAGLAAGFAAARIKRK